MGAPICMYSCAAETPLCQKISCATRARRVRCALIRRVSERVNAMAQAIKVHSSENVQGSWAHPEVDVGVVEDVGVHVRVVEQLRRQHHSHVVSVVHHRQRLDEKHRHRHLRRHPSAPTSPQKPHHPSSTCTPSPAPAAATREPRWSKQQQVCSRSPAYGGHFKGVTRAVQICARRRLAEGGRAGGGGGQWRRRTWSASMTQMTSLMGILQPSG